MTPNGQIAIPLDKAAIREPFLSLRYSSSQTFAPPQRRSTPSAHPTRDPRGLSASPGGRCRTAMMKTDRFLPPGTGLARLALSGGIDAAGAGACSALAPRLRR